MRVVCPTSTPFTSVIAFNGPGFPSNGIPRSRARGLVCAPANRGRKISTRDAAVPSIRIFMEDPTVQRDQARRQSSESEVPIFYLAVRRLVDVRKRVKFVLASVVNRVLIAPALSVSCPAEAPQCGAAVFTILVQRVKIDVELAQLFQITVVAGDDALAGFETRVGR